MPTGVERLKKRAEFLRVASVRRKWVAPGMILQAAPASSDRGEASVRLGFTVTKKVGNAVVRNRVKRRLRAVAHEIMPRCAIEGRDYVLIGRRETLKRDFADLKSDLETALKRIETVGKAKKRPQHA